VDTNESVVYKLNNSLAAVIQVRDASKFELKNTTHKTGNETEKNPLKSAMNTDRRSNSTNIV
jgi:hypothetical protein